jgi:hypothetical protein
MCQKAIDGVAQDETLHKWIGANISPNDWSRDGRYIFEMIDTPPGSTEIWVLPLFGDRKAFQFVKSEFNGLFPRLSPNGRWLAYQSNETDRNEIFVEGFPDHSGKWQISTNGGTTPTWGADGRELYYVSADQKLIAVAVKDGAQFEHGIPKPLVGVTIAPNNGGAGVPWFDVSKDGRFLIATPVAQSTKSMSVVLNWPALLKQ